MDGEKARTGSRKILSGVRTAPLKPKDGLSGPPVCTRKNHEPAIFLGSQERVWEIHASDTHCLLRSHNIDKRSGIWRVAYPSFFEGWDSTDASIMGIPVPLHHPRAATISYLRMPSPPLLAGT